MANVHRSGLASRRIGVVRFDRAEPGPLSEAAPPEYPRPQELQDRVNQLAAEIGLPAHLRPLIAIVPARMPPLIWASLIGRPRLLLPDELWARLDFSQQNAVLVHELAHLKRGDHWVRWLEALVLGLYWWDPVAWWARRQIEKAEESSCDAWVLWSQPEAAGSYAEALLATTAFLSGVNRSLPLGASGVGSTFAFKRRLEMILSDVTLAPVARSRSWKFLALTAVCLPLLPALAAGEPPRAAAAAPSEQYQPARRKKRRKPARPRQPPEVSSSKLPRWPSSYRSNGTSEITLMWKQCLSNSPIDSVSCHRPEVRSRKSRASLASV